ncbi:MAG: helix-turn-helix transcriptional regulator [Lachnospiraceae bacterium]|nr:helix-turn-helix transcriptional regulator [Lachnospiraceae bacterium]
MGIRYYKLFDLLNRRGMKKSDLRSILSPKTVAKLSKGEYISGEAIEKICVFLGCQPGDIMEITVGEFKTPSDQDMYVTPHIDTNEIDATDGKTYIIESSNYNIWNRDLLTGESELVDTIDAEEIN